MLFRSQQLFVQLKNSKGKKQYGYLKPEVKKTVDAIVSCLAENTLIQKMYSEWCELEKEKYMTYTSVVKKFPPITENKVFKPIKNCVINTMLNMENIEIIVPENTSAENIETLAVPKNKFKNSEKYNRSAVQNAAASILNSLEKMIYEDYGRNTHSRYVTEHKLQNAIRRKKLALGIKDDRTVEREVEIHQ